MKLSNYCRKHQIFFVSKFNGKQKNLQLKRIFNFLSVDVRESKKALWVSAMLTIILVLLVLVGTAFAFGGEGTVSILYDITGTDISGNNYIGVANSDITVALLASPQSYMLLIADIGVDVLDVYNEFSEETIYFGTYDDVAPGTARNYVRLDYNDVDVVSRIRWGSGFHKILVRNVGDSINPQIELEVLE